MIPRVNTQQELSVLLFLPSRVSLSYAVASLFFSRNSSQKGICVTLSFESSSVPSTQLAGAHQSLAVQLSVLWQDGSQVFEYESIDLNSFGSPLPVGPHRNTNAELPLKCAYKDCVAGFRFRVQSKGVRRALSHPSSLSSEHSIQQQNEWSWRRFQLRFESSSDASTFIRLIQDIVPCKCTGTQQPSQLVSTQASHQPNRQDFALSRPSYRLSPPSHRASTSFPPERQPTQIPRAPTHFQPSSHALSDQPQPTSNQILSLLYATESGLSDPELERLVEEIVQEDGFLPFVERVRKLWKARIASAGLEF